LEKYGYNSKTELFFNFIQLLIKQKKVIKEKSTIKRDFVKVFNNDLNEILNKIYNNNKIITQFLSDYITLYKIFKKISFIANNIKDFNNL
jgi:hypothetical protein